MTVVAETGRVRAVPPRRGRGATVRTAWVLAAAVLLVLTVLASLALGSEQLSIPQVWRALWWPDDSQAAAIVADLRLPRTLLGLAAGAAFGLAGALIMALTRNPLADPGVLGVNAGAAFTVTLSVAVFGLTSFHQYVWFAFVGAVAAAVVVYLIGSTGRGGATPVRLTLAGVALSAVLSGISSGVSLLDPRVFDEMRYWFAGSLAGREPEILWQLLPFLVVGVALALVLSTSLNAVALGDDLATTVGVRLPLTRLGGVIAVTLLCGAATAAVGPIGFVGLMVPHTARWLLGTDQRWIFGFTVLAAPSLLLAADILGRLVVRPVEIEVGVVTAFLGAPLLILLVRRRGASGL